MDTIYDAKLLLVDDNAELLALLCEQLRGADYYGYENSLGVHIRTMATRTVWGYISGICGRSWKPNPVRRSFCGRCGALAIS